jgi:cytochrome-b5 reductase
VVDKAAGSAWGGGIGFVTPKLLKNKLPEPGDTTMVYVCGPPKMIEVVSGGRGQKMAGFLSDLGYPNVHKF